MNRKNVNNTKADYKAINKKISNFDWDFLNSTENINTITDESYRKINQAIHEHVPPRKVYSISFLLWYSPELKNSILKKKAAYVRFKESIFLCDLVKFKILQSSMYSKIFVHYFNQIVYIRRL